MVKYTKEQEVIIKHSKHLLDNSIMLVNACAGSGKTTTAVGIAKENSNKKLLYLVFNKNMQAEATKRFPKNTEVKTIHALAYSSVIKKGVHNVKTREYNASEIRDILTQYETKFSSNPKEQFSIAVNVKRILENYLNSKYYSIDRYFHSDSRTMGAHPDNQRYKPLVASFYNLMVNGVIDISHSAYLKVFHEKIVKNPKFLSNKYDIIILDEAQDTNPITWNILSSVSVPKICIGDVNQNIYGFRGTKNVMQDMANDPYVSRYVLNNNYRSTQEILDKANHIIKEFKKDDKLNENLDMKSMVDYSNDNEIKTMAVLSRTNASIIKTLLSSNDEYYLPRGADEVFKYVKNLINWLESGNVIDDEFKWLKKYKNITDLEKNYLDNLEANHTNDVELMSSLNLISLFGNTTIMASYYKAKNSEAKKDNTHLLTAHTAKGLEYDKVVLETDFPCLAELAYCYRTNTPTTGGRTISEDEFIEAINLAYVAFTRAKKVLIDNSPTLAPFSPLELENTKQTKTTKEVINIVEKKTLKAKITKMNKAKKS